MSGVVITGLGWVTPLGRELQPVWEAVANGERTVATELETGYGRTMPVLRIPEASVKDAAAFPRLRRSSAISLFAVAAAMDAVAHAGLDTEQLKRTALIFTSSDGGVVYTRKFYAEIVERNLGAGSPLLFPETVYNASASHIAARLGITGEALTLVGDSSAGITAVQTATELLATGEADHCLVVAAQEIDGITWEAYSRWKLVAEQLTDAKAFLSEGAAALVLSRGSAGRAIRQIQSGQCYTSRSDAARKFHWMIEGLPTDEVDLIVGDSAGTREWIEQSYFRQKLPAAAQIQPKFTLGESQSSSTLQHIIAAVLALNEGQARSALVTACGFNQQMAALVLT